MSPKAASDGLRRSKQRVWCSPPMTHILLSLLLLYPSLRGHFAAHPEIPVAIETAAQVHGVPTELLLTLCFFESGAGSSRRAHALCGVGGNTSRERQPDRAAQILAQGYRLCRSWGGAVMLFRWGRCGGEDATSYRPRALALAATLGGAPIDPPRRLAYLQR